jgi:hypothetical protein
MKKVQCGIGAETAHSDQHHAVQTAAEKVISLVNSRYTIPSKNLKMHHISKHHLKNTGDDYMRISVEPTDPGNNETFSEGTSQVMKVGVPCTIPKVNGNPLHGSHHCHHQSCSSHSIAQEGK